MTFIAPANAREPHDRKKVTTVADAEEAAVEASQNRDSSCNKCEESRKREKEHDDPRELQYPNIGSCVVSNLVFCS